MSRTIGPSSLPVSPCGEVRDGKLAHNWVERSAYELMKSLQEPAR